MIDLGESFARDVTAAGTVRRLRRGERLILEGFRHGAVLFISRGTLRVTSSTEEGHEVTLAIRGPGQLVGELAPLSGESAGASAVAREDGELVVINAARFVEIVRGSSEHTSALIVGLIAMFNEAEVRRVDWLGKSVPGRVLSELALLATAPAFRGRSVSVTQSEIADLCGVSRSSVSKVLKSLRELGIVSTERGRIVVADLDGLRRVEPDDLVR